MDKGRAFEIIGSILKLQDAGGGNEKWDHIHADDILCELLEGLGCGEIVAIFRQIDKWYG